MPTEEEGKVAQPRGPDFGINSSCGGRIIIFGGGIPIRQGNLVVGAVGGSSGTVDQDCTVGRAGLSAIEVRIGSQRGHS